MSAKPPKYSYFLAIVSGIFGFIIPALIPISFIAALAVVYFVLGGFFGFAWPKESWRWGLWIAGPMMALLSLSVLFAGQLDVFFK